MVAKLLDIDVELYRSFATFPEMVEKEFDNWINLFKIMKPARKKRFVDILKRKYTKVYCPYCNKEVYHVCIVFHNNTVKHEKNFKQYNQDI